MAGAGPVGMITAILLAQGGVRTRVVDKEPGTATQSYACALHPATLQFLAEMGLERDILELGRRLDTVALYDGHRRRTEIKLSRLPGDFPFLLVLPQGALEEALEVRLARKLNLKIDWNHRLSTIQSGADTIQATVDKLVTTAQGYSVPHMEWTVGKTLRIQAGFLIGADGHQSHVRQCLGIDYDCLALPLAFEVYEFETDTALEPEVRVVLDEKSTNVLWPLPGNRCRWSFESVTHREGDEFPAKDRSVIAVDEGEVEIRTRAHMQKLMAERAPWFQGSIGDINWNTEVQFVPGLSRRFGQGRCWLAGDSAHQAGPVGMQGMNVGILEGAELVAIIKRILHEHGSPDLLDAYASGRRREWLQLLGAMGGPKARAQTDPWIRGLSARLLPCLPASGGHLAHLLDQLGLDLP